ncbi:MAG: ABC transporter ATP-binding protein [Leptospiraceae bacterium]|nr:ABC transporter ATP-binding protein [Leptospiraceae bacterium]
MKISTGNPLSKIQNLLRLESKDVTIIIFYGLVMALLSLIVPVAISSLVNTVAFGVFLQPVLVLTFIVFVAYIFLTVLTAMQTILAEMIQRRFFARSAIGIANRMPFINRDILDDYYPPELVNRFFDTMTVQKGLITLMLEAIPGFLGAMVGLFIIALYHPYFLVFDIIILLITVPLLGYYLGRNAYNAKMDESTAKYKVAAWLQDISRHNLTFRTVRGFDYAMDRNENNVNEYLSSRAKYFKFWMRQFVGFLGLKTIGSSFFLGLGGYLVIQRELTLGQLVAAEIIVLTIIDNLTKFGKYLEVYYDVSAAIVKLTKLEEIPLVERRKGLNPDVQGALSIMVQNLSLEDSSGNDFVSNLSFKIPSGKILGITGDNPIGAALIIDAIAGLREPAGGIIQLQEFDQRDLDEEFLRSKIVLLRGNEIFEGSLIENVQLRNDCPETMVRDALERVGLNGNLTKNLNTGLTDHLQTYGSELNPTTAHQVTAARAILQRPGILLVDEFFDDMADYGLENMKSLMKEMKRKTTMIIVTYNPDILALCDSVLMFRNLSYKISTSPARGKRVR